VTDINTVGSHDRGNLAVAGNVDALLTDGMATVGLAELDAAASLRTRRERKYVVTRSVAQMLLARLGAQHDVSILEVDGRTTTHYSSMYFDTADLASFRSTAVGRRRRFKVRVRCYEGSDARWVEVKTRGRSDQVDKVRNRHHGAALTELSLADADFVRRRLVDCGIEAASGRFEPVVETRYHRVTVGCLSQGWRSTFDSSVIAVDRHGLAVALPVDVIIETKSVGPHTAIDRLLWAQHLRPIRVSKFGVAMMLTQPLLTSNRWNRIIPASAERSPHHR
jgi:hypothetical protein